MRKEEFLAQLREGLSGLPQDDVEERVAFYAEMIDDRMEEGLSEEEAVAEMIPVEQIAGQAVADIPLAKLAKERIKPKRRLRAWEIVLLVLGSPIWLSLLIAAFAVILSLYISVWAVVISLWAVFSAVAGSAFGCTVAGIVFVCSGNTLSGFAVIGGAFVCAGLAILLFYCCTAATKATVLLAKKIPLWIKRLFIGKEEA